MQAKGNTIGTKFKIFFLFLGLLLIIIIALQLTNTVNFTNLLTSKTTTNNTAPIKQLPAHPAANNGEKTNSTSSTIIQGTSKDSDGTGSANTAKNTWTVSQSGSLTLQEPIEGSSIASGVELVGTSADTPVQYTLIDNSVGVISQGTLSTNNGKFSGTITFHKYSDSGRLDVFNTNPDTGSELNEVQVNVVFK